MSFGTKEADRFGAGESLTYLITGSMLIDSDIFSYTNAGAAPQDTAYYAAAHIQGIGHDGRDSARIGAITANANVPEPATMLMLGVGGVAMITYRKRKALGANAA